MNNQYICYLWYGIVLSWCWPLIADPTLKRFFCNVILLQMSSQEVADGLGFSFRLPLREATPFNFLKNQSDVEKGVLNASSCQAIYIVFVYKIACLYLGDSSLSQEMLLPIQWLNFTARLKWRKTNLIYRLKKISSLQWANVVTVRLFFLGATLWMTFVRYFRIKVRQQSSTWQRGVSRCDVTGCNESVSGDVSELGGVWDRVVGLNVGDLNHVFDDIVVHIRFRHGIVVIVSWNWNVLHSRFRDFRMTPSNKINVFSRV